MRHEPDIDLACVREQVAHNVLGAEAVADGGDLLGAVLGPELDQGGVDDGVDGSGVVARGSIAPCLEGEVGAAV